MTAPETEAEKDEDDIFMIYGDLDSDIKKVKKSPPVVKQELIVSTDTPA